MAFRCENGFEEDCFTDISFEICATNESTESVDLVEVSLSFADQTFNVLEDEVSVDSNDKFCVKSESNPISLCGEPMLEAFVTVSSDECEDTTRVTTTLAPRPTGKKMLILCISSKFRVH